MLVGHRSNEQSEQTPSCTRRSDTDAHSVTSPVSALSPVDAAFIPQSPIHSPTGFAATMPFLTSSHSPMSAAALTSRRKMTPFSIENLLNSREQQERERIIEMAVEEEEEEEEDAGEMEEQVHEDPSGIPNLNFDGKEDENKNNKSWHEPEEINAPIATFATAAAAASLSPKLRHEIPRPTPLSEVVPPPSASAAAAMNFLAAAGASGGGSGGGGGPSSALAVAMAHHISNLLPPSSSSSSVASHQSTSPVPSPSPPPTTSQE